MRELIHGHKAIKPPKNVPVWDIDPYAPENLTQRRYFDQLRTKGPVVFMPKYGILACGRYDVTKEVFSDHKRFVSSRGVGMADFHLETPWRPPSIVLEVDPPYHTRTRRAIMKALSPKVVRDLKDAFLQDARDLVAFVETQGTIEAVRELAEAFPTRVFPKAVGIKQPNTRMLIDYGAMAFNAIGPDNDLRRASMANALEIIAWVSEQCARDKLTSDGIGAILFASADAGDITEEEAGLLVRSLLTAGVDTTVTGIGNALWCFANNPEQYALLRSDPEGLALAAFEETLRYTSPVQAFYRTAAMDTQVAGITIEEGTKILCVLGAANLDADRWDNPQQFDISRQAAGHLALGAGVHTCVGQNIARAEGQAILRALAERVSKIELDGVPKWRPNNAIHALDRLPIKLVV